MAKEFDPTNRGMLMKSSKKETDKHPDYFGELNIEGASYKLAGWISMSAKGNKYLSLKAELAKEEKKEAPKKSSKFEEGEIPF